MKTVMLNIGNKQFTEQELNALSDEIKTEINNLSNVEALFNDSVQERAKLDLSIECYKLVYNVLTDKVLEMIEVHESEQKAVDSATD